MIFTSDAEERNFREYEEIAAEEARQAKEYAERPFKRTGLGELLDALESEARDSIKEANIEIGVFLKCKETFNTQYIKDMSNYFITLAKYQIERDYDDIQKWREWRKEYCRLRRGG